MSTPNYATPERSLQQRKDALQTANAVRFYRATLKQDLKAGRVSVVDLLCNPPKKIETMKVSDLLMATPRLGRTKVNHLLMVCRISQSKTVEGMSERQRNELVSLLSQRY